MRSPGKNIIIVVLVSIIVIASIVAGVLVLDPPAEERLRRLDERRVNDLRQLAYAIDLHWTREGVLPSALDSQLAEIDANQIADPETGEAYGYRKVDEDTYELCATFSRDTSNEHLVSYREFWLHSEGRQCFQLKARDVERVLERR